MLRLSIKNLTQSKIRTLAAIMTVAISCMMFFFSFIYGRVIEDELSSANNIEAENCEIRIEYASQSGTRVITSTALEPLKDKLVFAVGVLDLFGTTEINGQTQYINLRGIEEDALGLINNVEYTQVKNRALRRDEVIISESTADKYNLKMDSWLAIKIGSVEKIFYVSKIAKNHRCFEEPGAIVVYGMENFVSEYIGSSFGRLYNKIYIKAVPGTDLAGLIDEIKAIDEYRQYKVNYEKNIISIVPNPQDISLPVIAASVGCAALSLLLVYLILSAGQKKQNLFVSQLKALGASDSYIAGVYVINSIFYTVAGVALGVSVCAHILKYGVSGILTVDGGSPYYRNRLIISAAAAFVSVFAFTLLPLIKLRGVPVRKAFVSAKNTVWKGNPVIFILSILMIVASVILVSYRQLNAVRGVCAFILCCAGAVTAAPYILKGLAALFLKLTRSGILTTAFKNLKEERGIVGNTRIIAAGLMICAVMGSASLITSEIGVKIINDIDCDIIISNVRGDTPGQINIIKDTEGVSGVYALQFQNIKLKKGDKEYAINLFGIGPDESGFLSDVKYITPKEELFNSLDKGMAINIMYHKVFGLNKGDSIPVTINGKTENITIAGYFNSYQYAGRMAVIDSGYLSALFDIPPYNMVICKTSKDVDTTIAALRTRLGSNNLYIINKHTAFGAYTKVIGNITDFTNYFTAFMVIVCFAGIAVNIINIREERKFSQYQLYSLGFSKTALTAADLTETAVSGIVAAGTALLSLFIINSAVQNLLSVSKIYVEQAVSAKTAVFIGLLFLLMYALIAITSYFTIKAGNLIKVLKSEQISI